MLLALNPSPSAFSPDRHGPASGPSDHSHRPSTSQQQQNNSSHAQPAPSSSSSSTSPNGKEWRISVGLTNDVQFVPAKNASVLGAGIDGKYKPISDSDMEMSDSDADISTVPSQPNAKGKAKATDEDIKMGEPNTPVISKPSLSAPVTSPGSGATGSSSSSSSNATVVPPVPLRIRPRPIPTHWPPGLKLGRGLFNSGNTCFLNSVLQALLYTRPLLHILRHHANCEITGYCVVCELSKVAETNFHSGQRGYFNPKNITQKLPLIAKGMRIGRQEDAHEFLRYIIDACQKVCLQRFPQKERPKHTENTWVHRIFGGKTRSRVSCKRCGHNSDTFETCLDLSLDLGQGVTTVEEALAAFVKPERLGGKGDDRYKCEKCKIPVDAEKQFTIETAPQVLTIHLKRFTGTGRKIGRAIGYPTSLDLAPYVSEGTDPLMYSLYGIIAHSGSGPHSGHYYAHIKSPDDRWHEMNDEEILPGTLSPPLHLREAYILFYIQSPSPRLRSVRPVHKPFPLPGEEDSESQTPSQPPSTPADKVFGSAEIAAASAREQEKMSGTQKALSLKINKAETMKKAGAASPVTSTITAVAVSTSSRLTPASTLVDFMGEDDEDLGEKVESPSSSSQAKQSVAPKFIGPQLPPGRNPPLQASGASSTAILADSVDKMNLLSPINSKSFYGSSDSNPKKRASSPATIEEDEATMARKKKRHTDTRSLMSGVASDTLGLKNKEEVHSKLGYPGGPPEKFKPWHSGGGIKKAMQKKNKHRSFLM